MSEGRMRAPCLGCGAVTGLTLCEDCCRAAEYGDAPAWQLLDDLADSLSARAQELSRQQALRDRLTDKHWLTLV